MITAEAQVEAVDVTLGQDDPSSEVEMLKRMAAAADRGEDPDSVLTEQERQPEVAESSEEGEPPVGDGEEAQQQEAEQADESQPEADGSGTEVAEAQPDPQPESESEPDKQPKFTRAQKKAQALSRSWENADRRHRQAAEREQQLDAREARLAQLEQQIQQRNQPAPDDPMPKYSAGEIAESLSEFIDDGDFDTAKALVKSLAQKAEANKAASSPTGPESPAFQQAWETNRKAMIQANPDLTDTQSELFKEASGLLQGDWGQVLNSHPAGVTAAVEVAKLRLAAASVPELEAEVTRLETEISQLKKATQLGKTGASSRDAAPASRNMTPEQEIEALLSQARRLERV